MPNKKRRPVTKNIATETVMRFQRQELKFLVDNHLVELLTPELSNFLQRDEYAGPYGYDIHSIYFDTIDWQAFYTKIDGNKRRQKFRIRSYTPHPDLEDTVFVEIKEKNSGTVYKRRTPVSLRDAIELSAGRPIHKQSPVIDEWRYGILRNSLKPKVLNSYRRLAFNSEHFPGLRITIDQDLTYCMVNDIHFSNSIHNAFWSRTYSVLEVKFDRYVPQFVIDLIRRYNLTQVPVSKYCDSVISHFLLS